MQKCFSIYVWYSGLSHYRRLLSFAVFDAFGCVGLCDVLARKKKQTKNGRALTKGAKVHFFAHVDYVVWVKNRCCFNVYLFSRLCRMRLI